MKWLDAAAIADDFPHCPDAPILFGTNLFNPSPRDYQIRKAAVKKAAALDPGSLEIRILLASIACEDWQWSKAEEQLPRARAMNPNNAESHAALGTFLFAMGRGEKGEKEQQIAQALDPNVDHLCVAAPSILR